MSEELMPLADIAALFDQIDDEGRLIYTARAAHRFQEEVERLKTKNEEIRTSVSQYMDICSELSTKNEALRKEKDELRTSLPSNFDRECMRIGQEIQRAAGVLPEGYEMQICVERDAGWVSMYDQDGEEVKLDSSGEGLSSDISQAIDTAMKNGGDGE